MTGEGDGSSSGGGNARGLLVVCLATGAAALNPTKVLMKTTCGGGGWALDFPATTPPTNNGQNGPVFNFTISTAALSANVSGASPSFTAQGSLGLANHPLGLFKFDQNGDACGRKRVYIYDGILGVVDVDFPACPWAAGAATIHAHVQVWTVIPAQEVVGPVGVGTGFEIHLGLAAGGSDVVCAQLNLNQPADGAHAGAEKDQDVCNMENAQPWKQPYPVPATDATDIPQVTVNLDEDPKTRWDAIVKPRAAAMKLLIDSVAGSATGPAIKAALSVAALKYLKSMGDYGLEIEGIAKSTGITVGELWVMNMMYEVEGLCTSIVAQDKDGHVIHGRNLDFGLFTGNDKKTHTWKMTELLRPVLVNVQFTRGGKPLYSAIAYAGYVGVHSALRPGSFSATVNSRFDTKLDGGLIGWLLGLKNTGNREFTTFKLREALENDATYDDALKRMTSFEAMGPAYVIMGGTAKGQGAVLSLESNHSSPVDTWTLDSRLQEGSYYVLQTNYDRTKPPPAYDDRRYPGMNCMDKVGQAGITYSTLWDVLSSNPNMNGLTTFTMLMSAETGHWEAHKQQCLPGPGCNPF